MKTDGAMNAARLVPYKHFNQSAKLATTSVKPVTSILNHKLEGGISFYIANFSNHY